MHPSLNVRVPDKITACKFHPRFYSTPLFDVLDTNKIMTPLLKALEK